MTTPVSGSIQFATRASIAERVLPLAFMVVAIALVIAEPTDYRGWLCLAVAPFFVYIAWRGRLVVTENTLFVFTGPRGRLGRFVRLDDLVVFSVERHLSRVFVPYRSLVLRDSSSDEVVIDLWGWQRWRELMALITEISGRQPLKIAWLEGAGDPPFTRPKTPGM